jgi:hypothetical protein
MRAWRHSRRKAKWGKGKGKWRDRCNFWISSLSDNLAWAFEKKEDCKGGRKEEMRKEEKWRLQDR